MTTGSLTPEDRIAITDLFADYAWAYDCGDAAAYAEVFAPDGVLAGDDGHEAVGRAAIQADIQRFFDVRGKATWQHYTDQLKVIGGDTACTVYSYWAVLCARPDPSAPLPAGEHGVAALGYCVNDCVKLQGRWYIQRRHWHFGMPRTLPWKANTPTGATDSA